MKILALALPGLLSVVLFGACGSPHPAACLGGGQPCMGFADCCSGVCNNGACGGAACSPPGAGCGHNGDCCTKLCFQGACEACVASGTPCTDDQNCCSMHCNNNGICG
jgi:hypothetical protein